MSINMPTRLTFVFVLLITSFIFWFFVLSTKMFYLDDRFFVVLGDDAMVSMRYAKNWADGFGLFWNKSGSPEGYTNFLLVCVMALIHLFDPDVAIASLYVLEFNWVITVLTVWVCYKSSYLIFKNNKDAMVTSLLAAFSFQALYWSAAGFETALLSFFAIASIFCILNKKLITASLVMALGVLTRDDFSIFVFSFGAVFPLIYINGLKKQLIISLKLSIIPLLFFVTHLLWRKYYYGDFLPNTYYLKATGWIYLEKIQAGMAYLLGLTPIIIVSLLAYWWLYRSSKSKSEQALYLTLFFLIFLFSLYTINVAGDSFSGARLFAPIFPVFAIAGAFLIKKYQNSGVLTILFALVFVFYPLNRGMLVQGYNAIIPVAYVLVYGEKNDVEFPRHFSMESRQKGIPPNVRNVQSCQLIKKYIKENSALKSSMAVYYAGVPPYMCNEFLAIDLLGKSDHHIARTRANPGRVGHNKYDYDYSLSNFKPTFILSLMPSIGSLKDESYLNRPMREFNWHLLVKSEEFMNNYRDQYLRPEISPIFIRKQCLRKQH